MRLTPVYVVSNYRVLLWKLLQERTPDQSISHKEMPQWAEHVLFVDSKPYRDWLFIIDGEKVVGSIYITRHNEIGISVFNEHRRKGYAKWAIRQLMIWYDDDRILANINPKSKASIKLFGEFGFKLVQNTYSLERR